MHRRAFLHTLSAVALMAYGIETNGADNAAPIQARGEQDDCGVKDQLPRSRRPDLHYCNDVFIDEADIPALHSLHQRLERLQRTVGHGNFALLGIDEMRTYGRNYPFVGRFTPGEEALIEKLFYADASLYGFFGEKPLSKLSARIERRALSRQSGSSQFLFKGEAIRAYDRIKRALGDEVVLTSGVRGVVKQLHLFLSKVVDHGGNLSLASRSLAPPGYSYHGIGDFDVGQSGWGAFNFTTRFAESDVFKRLQDLGYITMRYPADNLLGVRYEPWHIKVVGA